MKKQIKPTVKAVPEDTRTADQRVEDVAFQNRIKVLTAERKWNELMAVFMVYGSALEARE